LSGEPLREAAGCPSQVPFGSSSWPPSSAVLGWRQNSAVLRKAGRLARLKGPLEHTNDWLPSAEGRARTRASKPADGNQLPADANGLLRSGYFVQDQFRSGVARHVLALLKMGSKIGQAAAGGRCEGRSRIQAKHQI